MAGVRPVLRPGLRVAETAQGALLVDATTAVPVSERVVALLRRLDGLRDIDSLFGRSAEAEPDAAALAWLQARGLVVDLAEHERRMAEVRPRGTGTSARTSARTAAAGGTGATDGVSALLNHPDADQRWHARRGARLRVHGTGRTAHQVTELLAGAGIGQLDLPGDTASAGGPWVATLTERHRSTRFTRRRDGDADLELVLYDHEPPLELLEGCCREDRPHLIAGLRHPTAVVGPLVVPGWSACHRCADLARGDDDPRWPYLREALGTNPVGATGVPPLDPAQTRTLAALAFAEVLAFVEGRPPRTLNAVLRLDPDGWPRPYPLRPHPRCGCSWPGATRAPAALP